MESCLKVPDLALESHNAQLWDKGFALYLPCAISTGVLGSAGCQLGVRFATSIHHGPGVLQFLSHRNSGVSLCSGGGARVSHAAAGRGEPSCSRPSGGGHCRPRSPLRPPLAPGAQGLWRPRAPFWPPPRLRHPRTPSSGQRHTWVPPAPRPACAHRAHLHLDTERLQGRGLPGWTWRSRHWALRGIWGFRDVRLPPGGGGETPAKSRDSRRIPCVFEYSAHLDMFRSQKTTVMQAARRVSNLKNRKAEQVEKDLGGQVATC
uniref:uncharacterized protein LOC132663347 n=1 Tax=Panthera onca TaxID=9690 RepID=UPI002953D949|nr:uncharacterized protein LOC132663347 [Panthera onca]